MDSVGRVAPLNLDSLYEAKKKRSMIQLRNFQTILLKAHDQIKTTARDPVALPCCWFVVPTFVFGLSQYDFDDCVSYVQHELQNNGFQVRYYYPNTLFISWEHVVPKYVRDELRKTKGIVVDQFGQVVPTAEELPPQPPPKAVADTQKPADTRRPADTYQPSGKLLYSAKMIHQLTQRVKNK